MFAHHIQPLGGNINHSGNHDLLASPTPAGRGRNTAGLITPSSSRFALSNAYVSGVASDSGYGMWNDKDAALNDDSMFALHRLQDMRTQSYNALCTLGMAYLRPPGVAHTLQQQLELHHQQMADAQMRQEAAASAAAAADADADVNANANAHPDTSPAAAGTDSVVSSRAPPRRPHHHLPSPTHRFPQQEQQHVGMESGVHDEIRTSDAPRSYRDPHHRDRARRASVDASTSAGANPDTRGAIGGGAVAGTNADVRARIRSMTRSASGRAVSGAGRAGSGAGSASGRSVSGPGSGTGSGSGVRIVSTASVASAVSSISGVSGVSGVSAISGAVNAPSGAGGVQSTPHLADTSTSMSMSDFDGAVPMIRQSTLTGAATGSGTHSGVDHDVDHDNDSESENVEIDLDAAIPDADTDLYADEYDDSEYQQGFEVDENVGSSLVAADNVIVISDSDSDMSDQLSFVSA